MTLTAVAIWLNTFFYGFDRAVTSAVHRLYDLAPGIITPFMEFISFLGHDGIILIIFAFLMMLFKKTRRFGTAMLLGLAVGAIATNLCIKVAVARPRPYSDATMAYHGDFFRNLWIMMGQHAESDLSFPSGHTTAAFAAMTGVFLTGKKSISWTAYIFAVLMALSRIYLVVHFPSDVLFGIVVGTAAGMIGTLIARKLPAKYYEFRLFSKKIKGEDECSAA